MGSGLSELDGAAISDAIRILTEAGYSVEKAGEGRRCQHGVAFRLDLEAPTRAPWFHKQADAVKDAAIEAPEFDMGGIVEEADDDA